MTEFVSVHTADDQPGIATLLLSRPPTNTLTRQVYREIAECARDIGGRDGVRAVIVFGGHEIFSAGDDLPEVRTLSPDELHTVSAACRAAVDAVAAIPKPTVAALTGYVLGGGLTLALAADWRVSGDNVKFGATEILNELVPAGGTSRLVETVGMSKAKDMVLSGRFVDAREALALRLIDEMVAPDNVYDAALAWAQRFVDHSPQALADAKAAFDV